MPAAQFLDWSGGIQNRSSRFLRKDNELRMLVNGHNDEVGSITKRLGYRKVGTTDVQTGQPVYAVGAAATYLYSGSNDGSGHGQLKYNDSATAPVGGAWTATTITAATDIPTNSRYYIIPFAEIKSTIFGGGIPGASVAGDFMITQYATSAAPATLNRFTYAPRSRWAVRYRDRIYHGNCYPGTTWTGGVWYNESAASKPNRIVFSKAPANGSLSYEDQGLAGYLNFMDLNADNTGLGANSDQLLMFTAQSLVVRSGTETTEGIPDSRVRYNIGCENGATIKNMDIFTFWYNRNGIYAYSGGKPELISNKIQPIIDGIASPVACFADTPDDDHYRLYVGTLTLEGKSFRNCVIQYTMSTNSWAVYSYTVPTTPTADTWTSFGSYNDGTKTRMYAGTSSGQVHVFSESKDTSSALIYSDGDQANYTYPIFFFARTKEIDYGMPQEQKVATPMTVYATQGLGTKVLVRADPASSNGEFKEIGQIYKEVENFSVNPASAYWHQFEFTENSVNPPLTIQGFTVSVQQDTTTHD